VDRELEVIHGQMEETRASLADKLEALESQVRGTVQNVSEAISSTVGGVKEAVQSVTDTVGTVTDRVSETAGEVKEKVAETVQAVAETFDITRYVEQSPWTAVGVSVAVGFCAAKLLPSTDRLAQMATRPSEGPREMFGPEVTSHLKQIWDDTRNTVQSLAVGTLMGAVREWLTKSVPGEWQGELTRMVDNITNELGGKPVEGHWLTEWFQGRHNGHGNSPAPSSSSERRETFHPGAQV
jgi:ElaB/YqjD/DUF883 family membrane-anchored ribosome-binding protein